MTIAKAKFLGFCGGVRRAVQRIETELAEQGPLHTLGAIVHNAHVVDALRRRARGWRGASTAGGTVAITAHGAGEEVYAEIERRRPAPPSTRPARRAQQAAASSRGTASSCTARRSAPKSEGSCVDAWARHRHPVSPMSIPIGEKGIRRHLADDEEPGDVCGVRSGMGEALHGACRRCASSTRRARRPGGDTRRPRSWRRAWTRSRRGKPQLGQHEEASGPSDRRANPPHRVREGDRRRVAGCGKRLSAPTAGASTPDDVIEDVVRRLRGRAGGSSRKQREEG